METKKTEKTYTIEEIKKAFWSNFHKSGETWFDYLGTDEENDASTNEEWDSFLNELFPKMKQMKKLNTKTIPSSRSFEITMDIDWSDITCPCGATLSGRNCSPEDWQEFVDKHTIHTNGYETVTVTDDWHKITTSKPAPYTHKIQIYAD